MTFSPSNVVPISRRVTFEAQLDQLRTSLATVERERDEFRKLFEAAQQEIERLRRQLFGPRREKFEPAESQLAFASITQVLTGLLGTDEDTNAERDETSVDPPSPTRERVIDDEAKKRRNRRVVPEHVPVERIELSPPPFVDESWKRIGEEISETLEWRPASFVRVQWVRGKYVCPNAVERGVAIAELPARSVDRGSAGPGLLAHVLVSKYADHLPLYRQSVIFDRQGISLSRSTLCGWVERSCAALSPLVEAMWKHALQVSPLVAIDATGVLVQAPERCKRGHFWVTIANGEAFFRFTPKHNSATVNALLPGYRGIVLADAATVYDALYRSNGAVEAGCWAHCRRGFFEAMSSEPKRASVALEIIAKLYEADRSTRNIPLDQRTKLRAIRAKPWMDALRQWLDQPHPEVLARGPLGQAMTYTRNQWAALSRFLDDGRIPLDNNASERELRRIAVGRKNWLFVGSEEGAEWTSTAVSLVASCAMAKIEPWAYLRDVLTVLPTWPASRILELAPKAWMQTRQQLNAEQLAGRQSCAHARNGDARPPR